MVDHDKVVKCAKKILQVEESTFHHGERTRYMRNLWIKSPPYNIYMRSTFRSVNYQTRTTLDLASFEVAEKQRGKGYMTALVNYLLQHSRASVIFIENLDPRHHNWAMRLGFVPELMAYHNSLNGPISYYKFTKGETKEVWPREAR